MSLWDKLTGEFIDVIEWDEDGRDALVWRFPRDDNAIKTGAHLIVREGQHAVFVCEGQVVDQFGCGWVTICRAFGEANQTDSGQLAGHDRIGLGRRNGIAGQSPLPEQFPVGASEGTMPRKQFVEDDAQAPNVAATVQTV